MPTEDERAAQYRRDQQAGENAAVIRWRALAGNKAAYKALLGKVRPLQRDAGWDPIERVRENERAANG